MIQSSFVLAIGLEMDNFEEHFRHILLYYFKKRKESKKGLS